VVKFVCVVGGGSVPWVICCVGVFLGVLLATWVGVLVLLCGCFACLGFGLSVSSCTLGLLMLYVALFYCWCCVGVFLGVFLGVGLGLYWFGVCHGRWWCGGDFRSFGL